MKLEGSMNLTQRAIRMIKAIRKGITLGKKLTIKKLRTQGRR